MMHIIPKVSLDTFEKVLAVIPCEPISINTYLFGGSIMEPKAFFKDDNIHFDNNNNVEVCILSPTKDKLLKIYEHDLNNKKLPRASFKEAKFYYNEYAIISSHPADISFDLTPYSLTISFYNKIGVIDTIIELCKKLFETKMNIVINKMMEEEHPQSNGVLTTNFKNQFE